MILKIILAKYHRRAKWCITTVIKYSEWSASNKYIWHCNEHLQAHWFEWGKTEIEALMQSKNALSFHPDRVHVGETEIEKQSPWSKQLRTFWFLPCVPSVLLTSQASTMASVKAKWESGCGSMQWTAKSFVSMSHLSAWAYLPTIPPDNSDLSSDPW